MNIEISNTAKKQLKKLPKPIQKKTHKAFNFLLNNYRHPSLRTKKKTNQNEFEASIDIHYRFSFLVESNTIYILTIGMHDRGLGKK